MNVNSFGNYFKTVGLEREVEQDETSYIIKEESGGITYYPKAHCYRAKGMEFIRNEYDMDTFVYSSAIDHLVPRDYVRWMKTRFKGL
jgi:HSP90 family molecular chaperone